MKLMVPARSLNMLNEMLQSKADEIYIGLKPEGFRQLSFDGRFQTISEHPAHCQSSDELEAIINRCKAEGVRVNFMANARAIPQKYEDAFIDHVRLATEMGVDSITIGSFQSAMLINNAGITTPLVAGSVLGITNLAYSSLLKDHNILRITLPHFMTLSEIGEFKDEGFEIIVKGNFTSGGAPGFCQLYESPNHPDFGDGTRSTYTITRKNNVIADNLQFLDAAGDCALCSLTELFEAGVSTVQLIGREAPNAVTMGMVVDMFKKWSRMYGEGKTAAEIKSHLSKCDVMWVMKWQPRFCEKQRCTYLPTPNTKAYV